MSTRLTITGALKQETGKQIIVGRGFAFLSPKALSAAGYSWLERLFKAKKTVSPHIVSLLGVNAVDLFGVSIEPTKVPVIALGAVISDKSIYKAEKDQINVLIVRPLDGGSKVTLHLKNAGAIVSKHGVNLDKNGAGKLQLFDLTAGDYEIVVDGETEPACQFVVAQYKLVPLVVNLLSRTQSKEGELTARLHLESFGVPLNGEVKLDLMDRHIRLSSCTVTAEKGEATATFALSGPGPHSIVAQVVADQEKTASFPLRGSRESERSFTCFSPLGTVISGSLLPVEESTTVRGIHLFEDASRSSPVTLERVDSNVAKLTINEKIEALKVVAVKPVAGKLATASDPSVGAHPEHADSEYKRATELFHKGEIENACSVFEAQRKKLYNPHCYYSYWIACCQAKLGQTEKALDSLQRSVREGWNDFTHMGTDDDLASLRDTDEFQSIVDRGHREFEYFNLDAGQVLEIPVHGPVTLLAIGAFISGRAWEGWASMLPPSEVTGHVEMDSVCTPGEDITIRVVSNVSEPTVFVLVKDARLLSTDTAEVKLAAGLKEYVSESSKLIPPEFVTEDLWQLYLASAQPLRGMSTTMWSTMSSDVPSNRTRNLMAPGSAPVSPPAGGGWGEGPAPSQAFGFASESSAGILAHRAAQTPVGSYPQPMAQMATFLSEDAGSVYRFEEFDLPVEAAASAIPGALILAEPQVSEPPVVIPQDEPEVLFAGFIGTENGVATLALKLPDCFAEYIVECFLITGMDWTSFEHRFAARKDCFIHLSTPVFTRENEPCVANVFVRTPEAGQFKLTCDGNRVELLDDALSPLVGAPEVEAGERVFRFLAKPGQYQAVLEQNGRVLAQEMKRVDETGKLRRIVRALKIVQTGETVNLSGDNSVRGLSVLPGIEKSFGKLVEETAGYEHLCCEQTAAKILSACAMYAMAGDDDDRASKAEAIVVAGIERERRNWLPGRGFTTYPDRGYTLPDTYYGPKAAKYLWNLGLLKELNTRGSAALSEAIELGLKMAEDTTAAYQISFPPSSARSCEEAYAVLRFGASSDAAAALSVARARAEVKDKVVPQTTHYLGVDVLRRLENAYAAAALFRGRNGADMSAALELANTVISDFNEQGALYSTVDSVAAIALMSELSSAGILTGGGVVELNGASMKFADAVRCTDPIESLKVVEGIATVAVDRIVEEDWNSYAGRIPLRVSLEKNGKHTRKLAPGDSVELVVKLEEGYKMGDLLWVALPDVLSRIVGGGQVKLFSLDFQGASELRVSLAVTGTTKGATGDGEQSLAVCVRNMFDEERAGSPGLMAITVKGG